MRVVTWTTDFGLTDWYVGAMKGVFLGINSRAVLVDIAHAIPRGDVRAGAFSLLAAYPFFPKRTIHVAVVDPGVGSERAAIAVETENYFFVGPDNGLLSLAVRGDEVRRIHRLENPKFWRQPPSRTFHGRDIFAPVAAHLSKGVPIERFGPSCTSLESLGMPAPRRSAGKLLGEIVYVDQFGNAISNLSREEVVIFTGGTADPVTVRIRGQPAIPLVRFYGEVPWQSPAALVGSTGFLEVAVNGGRGAEMLKLGIGTPIALSRS